MNPENTLLFIIGYFGGQFHFPGCEQSHNLIFSLYDTCCLCESYIVNRHIHYYIELVKLQYINR